MKLSSPKIVLTSLASLILLAGCVPAPDRIQTKVEKASDIKISVGSPSKPAAKAPASQSETPAASPAATTQTVAAANAKPEAKPAESAAPATPVAAPAAGGKLATFSGRVLVKGTAPVLPPLVKQGQAVQDAATCSKEAIPNQSLVVSPDGGLANVFVYIQKLPKGISAPKSEGHPSMDQKDCVFIPHAQVIPVGVPVNLKNSDPISHNLHIKGFVADFNRIIPPHTTEGIEYTFQSAERIPVTIVCDIHNWMSAWALPVDHPWATLTDKDGKFEIPNLPAGDLEFFVWHEKSGYVARSVKVKVEPGKAIPPQTFEVDASKLAK